MPRHRDDEPRRQDLNCAIYAVKDLHGNAVAIAGNDPMVYPQNGAGVTLTVKYSHMGSLDRLLAEALDEIEASVPDGFCATGCASLNVALPDGCFIPRPRLELRPRVDDDWETRYEAASPCHIRMDMARKTAMNAIDLMRRGYEDHGSMENAGSDTSKLGHLPVKHGLTEFVIPVTVTGVLTERVMADTFVQAQKKIQKKTPRRQRPLVQEAPRHVRVLQLSAHEPLPGTARHMAVLGLRLVRDRRCRLAPV